MLINFFTLVERQYQKWVKAVRSDNGREFLCLKQYFQQHGIIHQTSYTGTPQQNGRVERKHRHILNVARALRFQGNLPLRFWGECILTAGYLLNLTPSSVLNGKTPYEVITGKQPPYDHLRVFGCLCFAHNQHRQGDKFASRSRKCVFVGYSYGQKGWKLYDLEKRSFFVSRDVKFVEDQFPLGSCSPSTDATPTIVRPHSIPVDLVAEEEALHDIGPPAETLLEPTSPLGPHTTDVPNIEDWGDLTRPLMHCKQVRKRLTPKLQCLTQTPLPHKQA